MLIFRRTNCISTASGIVTLWVTVQYTGYERTVQYTGYERTVQYTGYKRTVEDCSVHRLREECSEHRLHEDCSVHRLREDSRNLCTEKSPKNCDNTIRCNNTIVLLKMSTIVLETCREI